MGDAARVTWNAGLFRTDSDDDILFTASAVQGRGFFRNVGSTRRQGVEAGVSLRQGSLLAYANYAYTEASFQSAFGLWRRSGPNPHTDPQQPDIAGATGGTRKTAGNLAVAGQGPAEVQAATKPVQAFNTRMPLFE